MTTQPKLASGSWRRFAHFSTRWLSFLILLLAAALAWFANRANVQRDAAIAIQKSGGKVWYDWEWQNDAPIPDAMPRWPLWLVNSAGVDYFGNIVSVSLIRRATDAELVHVGHLARLERLEIHGSSLSAAGLAQLKGLTNLSGLFLRRSRLDDTGLAYLKGLTSLKVLDLSNTSVSDAGLAQLEGLANLEELVLTSTRIGDAGLLHLKGLTNLRILDLKRTKVTDVGVAQLAGMPNLVELDLSNTEVSGAGLAHLSRLTRLERLVAREFERRW